MKYPLALSLFAFLALAPAFANAMEDRPNVLVISIDDLNDWVGCLGGHPQARTPNIDRLAERGTLFANAHCQAPICTPARASLVTGLLPTTTGHYFLFPTMKDSGVLQDHPTLLDAFRAAGYRTMGAGKFVHGKREEAHFDEYGGGFGGFGPNPPEKLNCPHGGDNWDWGAYPERDEDLPDWEIASWVSDRLRVEHEEPFFLVAGFWRPHVPMYAPQKWFDLFPLESVKLPEVLEGDRDDIPEYAKILTNGEPAPRHSWFREADAWRPAVQSYLAASAFVDAQVGRVLDALDAGPNRDDTIVVLFSDHGFHLGEKERWAKRGLWTDITRVPLIIDAPSSSRGADGEERSFPDGQVTDEPAALVDLFPTLLDLAGIAPETVSPDSDLVLDGLSLTPQLVDATTPRREPAICTYSPGNHSLHFRRWHFIHYADGSEELYDLDEDPHEWHNLASRPEQAERIAEFRTFLPRSEAEPKMIDWWSRWEVEDWRRAEAFRQSGKEKAENRTD